MVRSAPPRHMPPTGAYAVREPRRSDVMTDPLCTAYRDDRTLPADMLLILTKLDDVPN